MKDERIEQAKSKIRSELAIIILYGAALLFVVKTLVFHMNLQECLTEYLILVFFPIYQFIRMHMMKVSIYSKPGNKQYIRNLLIMFFILGSIFAAYILSSKKPLYVWQNSFIFLLIYILVFVLLVFGVNKFNQHQGHKYEKEFDDD